VILSKIIDYWGTLTLVKSLYIIGIYNTTFNTTGNKLPQIQGQNICTLSKVIYF